MCEMFVLNIQMWLAQVNANYLATTKGNSSQIVSYASS